MSTLRKPRWILLIIVGLVLSVWFVRLGFWQLSRLEERRASNALIEARMEEPPRSLDGLVGQYGTDPDSLTYRQAIVTGRYLTPDEFFSVGRNYDGVTGTLVMTPLELEDGSIMIIVRGLVPVGTLGPPAEGYEPPLGSVTLTGRLDDGEEPLRIGESPPESGKIESLSRVDLAYIDEWFAADVLPVDLLIDTQRPGNPGATPIPIPAPELTEGKHLGYAVQWFAFALMAFIGTFVLVWQAGTEKATSATSQATTSPE
jgi:cytochrome oxidase assembly protein ShyY1